MPKRQRLGSFAWPRGAFFRIGRTSGQALRECRLRCFGRCTTDDSRNVARIFSMRGPLCVRRARDVLGAAHDIDRTVRRVADVTLRAFRVETF